MTITVDELLQIPYFSSTEIVAGDGGRNRIIGTAGLLDYEYARSYEMKEQVFLKNDLVVSSLMFAQNDPDALMDAVKGLVDLGAAALVYKPVFYETLPEDVLDLANRSDFPILKADPELNMEEYIYHIIDNLQLVRRLETMSVILDDLIGNRISRAGLPAAADALAPNHRPYIYAAYLQPAAAGEKLSTLNLYTNSAVLQQVNGIVSICRYEKGAFILLSDQMDTEAKYDNRLEDVLSYIGLQKDNLFIGTSEIRRCPDEIDLVVQQAFNANKSARILGCSRMSFRKAGVFQILIPHAKSPHMIHFMEQYLRPLLEETDYKSEELLRTAITYVLSDNDAAMCAERLFCHKNTIRYRVNHLHELLDEDTNDATFNERLGIAIKLYLIHQLEQM